MRTLAQTEDGGLLWENPAGRGLVVVEGAEAAAVLFTNAMRQQPNDDPTQPARGIPYGQLLQHGVGPSQVRNALLRQARRVVGIRLIKLEVRQSARHFDVDVEIGLAGTEDAVAAKVILGGV